MHPIIEVMRHAEAEHNIMGPQVRDPHLTARGRRQTRHVGACYPHHNRIACVVASPMRRTIETALWAFALPGADHNWKRFPTRMRITLLPELQEINATPSGTGSPVADLVQEYGDVIDVTHLSTNRVGNQWFRKDRHTLSSPDPEKVEERARQARSWLHDLARTINAASGANTASTDDGVFADAPRIVVVTHGEFAHWLTEDFGGITNLTNTGFGYAEVRSYRFAVDDKGGIAEPVTLLETPWSAASHGTLAGISPPAMWSTRPAMNALLKDMAFGRALLHHVDAMAAREREDVDEEEGGTGV